MSDGAASLGRRMQLTSWQRHLGALGILATATLLLFHRDAADMASIWWQSSVYTHCLLMLPMIGWLVVQRMAQLAGLEPRYWWPALGWIALGGFVWVLGEAGGAAVLRHLGLMLMLQGAVAAALGEALVRALLFPLAYALLLVPFGDGLIPLLQDLTAQLSVLILEAAGIAARIDGIFITTSAGYFVIAEECSGIDFLVAMLAFAVFAAHLCFLSWRRRTLFVIAALAATVIANALRAAFTIAAAGLWGAQAAGGDGHILFGWIFFALVILFIMLGARRWFDRPADDMAVDVTGLEIAAALSGPARAVLPAALALPILFAAWGQQLDGRSAPFPGGLAISAPEGWSPAARAQQGWRPQFAGADHLLVRDFSGPRGERVTAVLAAYTYEDEGREVIAFGQGAAGGQGAWVRGRALPSIGGAHTEELIGRDAAPRYAASWYVVGGQATGDRLRAKYEGLKARLLGGDPRALAIIVSSSADEGGERAIEGFVDASGGAQAMADRALETR